MSKQRAVRAGCRLSPLPAIGVQVELRFTVQSLREARSALPAALGAIVLLMVSWAGSACSAPV